MTTGKPLSKYDNAKYWDKINHISKELSTSQGPKADRAAIIKLIKIYYAMAQELTPNDLLGGGGAVISANLCILLGMRYHDGVKDVPSGHAITKEDDPLLFELLTISSSLDINNNQPEKWERLFEVMRNL